MGPPHWPNGPGQSSLGWAQSLNGRSPLGLGTCTGFAGHGPMGHGHCPWPYYYYYCVCGPHGPYYRWACTVWPVWALLYGPYGPYWPGTAKRRVKKTKTKTNWILIQKAKTKTYSIGGRS